MIISYSLYILSPSISISQSACKSVDQSISLCLSDWLCVSQSVSLSLSLYLLISLLISLSLFVSLYTRTNRISLIDVHMTKQLGTLYASSLKTILQQLEEERKKNMYINNEERMEGMKQGSHGGWVVRRAGSKSRTQEAKKS